MTKLVLLTWVTLLLASGCAGSSVYVTQRVAMDTDPAITFAAVQRFAKERGWSIETAAPGAGFLELLTPPRLLGAVEVRDRWTFRVGHTGLEASKELEAHFDDDGWSSSSYVCDGYEYREERETLRDIMALVRETQPLLAANNN